MTYNIETIRTIMKSESGRNLKLFFDEEISGLRDINNIKVSLNPIKTAIEIRATKKAFKILTKILSQLCEWGEDDKPEPPRMPTY